MFQLPSPSISSADLPATLDEKRGDSRDAILRAPTWKAIVLEVGAVLSQYFNDCKGLRWDILAYRFWPLGFPGIPPNNKVSGSLLEKGTRRMQSRSDFGASVPDVSPKRAFWRSVQARKRCITKKERAGWVARGSELGAPGPGWVAGARRLDGYHADGRTQNISTGAQ